MATHAEIEAENYRRCAVWARTQAMVSVAELQRQFRLSYNGAVMVAERLEEEGIVGPPDAQGVRSVLAQPQG
jgi:S-DNA-T family DNA segregation ATPase FtsK/SpoIIIE